MNLQFFDYWVIYEPLVYSPETFAIMIIIIIITGNIIIIITFIIIIIVPVAHIRKFDLHFGGNCKL